MRQSTWTNPFPVKTKRVFAKKGHNSAKRQEKFLKQCHTYKMQPSLLESTPPPIPPPFPISVRIPIWKLSAPTSDDSDSTMSLIPEPEYEKSEKISFLEEKLNRRDSKICKLKTKINALETELLSYLEK